MIEITQKEININDYLVTEKPYYLPQGNEVKLFTAAYMNQLPVMLVGPTGCGKTRLVEYMAFLAKRPLFTVPCNDDLSANDLIGRYLINSEGTFWVDGKVLSAVRHSGFVYLDEIVEARKDTTVVIHPLTDHRRTLPVDKLGCQYKAQNPFMLIVSYNPTYQSVLKELKPSTRQRFVTIDMTWPKPELESQIIVNESGIDAPTATKLANAAEKLRKLENHGLDEVASTRLLIYAAKLMKLKTLPVKDILHATMIEPLTYDKELQRPMEEVLKNYFAF